MMVVAVALHGAAIAFERQKFLGCSTDQGIFSDFAGGIALDYTREEEFCQARWILPSVLRLLDVGKANIFQAENRDFEDRRSDSA